MNTKFQNEPLTDFTQDINASAFEKALSTVSLQFGRHYPAVINDMDIKTQETFTSINPARPSEVIGTIAKADVSLVERTIQSADEAFRKWKQVPFKLRARYLFHAAALMRKRKHEFSATMVFEVGKSWTEADADTAEAIDFMEFYARQMLRLGSPQPLTPSPGEDNEFLYIPLGVGVVIPPWNFPLAITVGMATAAIVAGNTVILKPSTNAPVIAAKFVELMREVHLPAGVLNFLPGPGGSLGDALVSHPKVRFISFTGSKEVGLRIHELAAKHQTGQIWLKRVILEMGGKDAVVVDETANIQAAAEGIVASAFGFQGQKCSAGSRAIIVEDVYDQVLDLVLERTRKLSMGPPAEKKNYIGPVVDQAAFEKISNYIEIGKKEGRLVAGGSPGKSAGYFIAPTIFENVAPQARIAQEEIFGPVLALIKADNFDQALQIANGTEYGLTGALYSMDRSRLERARHEFHVGNLYFNRKCTGALVGVHPFGGFNMSGTDSKAGGYDYLLQFLQGKCISEKY